jgi:hypothetical protein
MSDRARERLSTLLTEFREIEPEAPAWLDDPDICAFLRAWEKLSADIGEPLFMGQPPLHQHNRWAYLWKYRRVDHDKLTALSQLPANVCRDLFVKLVSARLIYPDGSLSRAAANVLSSNKN